MNLSEIIKKPVLEQHEAQFILEQYIKARTGKEVRVDVVSWLPPPFIPMQLHRMCKAATDACAWFLNQEVETGSPLP